MIKALLWIKSKSAIMWGILLSLGALVLLILRGKVGAKNVGKAIGRAEAEEKHVKIMAEKAEEALTEYQKAASDGSSPEEVEAAKESAQERSRDIRDDILERIRR